MNHSHIAEDLNKIFLPLYLNKTVELLDHLI